MTVNASNAIYSTSHGNNSGGYPLTTNDSYQWAASCSGATTNNLASDQGGSAAQVTVNTTSPSLATTPGGALTLPSTTNLSDCATLSGGADPTGTITFYLFAPTMAPNPT